MLHQPVSSLRRHVAQKQSSERIATQSNSVRRALAILELLKDSDRRRNLSEISRKLALPKSTTSMLLSTLEGMGYITRDEQRRYALSSKAFGFGLELLNQLDLSRRSRPVVEAIAKSLKVTATVAVLSGDQALFVIKADGVLHPCCDIYPSRRTNLQCTAVGKVLLAYAGPQDRRMFLARHRSIRHTNRTIVSHEALVEELNQVCKRGYAYDDQEEELMVRCLAVPVFEDGRAVAALGIVGSVAEIRSDNIEEIASYLKEMSNQISR